MLFTQLLAVMVTIIGCALATADQKKYPFKGEYKPCSSTVRDTCNPPAEAISYKPTVGVDAGAAVNVGGDTLAVWLYAEGEAGTFPSCPAPKTTPALSVSIGLGLGLDIGCIANGKTTVPPVNIQATVGAYVKKQPTAACYAKEVGEVIVVFYGYVDLAGNVQACGYQICGKDQAGLDSPGVEITC